MSWNKSCFLLILIICSGVASCTHDVDSRTGKYIEDEGIPECKAESIFSVIANQGSASVSDYISIKKREKDAAACPAAQESALDLNLKRCILETYYMDFSVYAESKTCDLHTKIDCSDFILIQKDSEINLDEKNGIFYLRGSLNIDQMAKSLRRKDVDYSGSISKTVFAAQDSSSHPKVMLLRQAEISLYRKILNSFKDKLDYSSPDGKKCALELLAQAEIKKYDFINLISKGSNTLQLNAQMQIFPKFLSKRTKKKLNIKSPLIFNVIERCELSLEGSKK